MQFTHPATSSAVGAHWKSKRLEVSLPDNINWMEWSPGSSIWVTLDRDLGMPSGEQVKIVFEEVERPQLDEDTITVTFRVGGEGPLYSMEVELPPTAEVDLMYDEEADRLFDPSSDLIDNPWSRAGSPFEMIDMHDPFDADYQNV